MQNAVMLANREESDMSFFDLVKTVATKVVENVDKDCDKYMNDDRFDNLPKEKRDQILKAKQGAQQALDNLNN